MNGIVGFVTLNDINKASELYIPHTLIAVGILIYFIINKFNFKNKLNLNEINYNYLIKLSFTYIAIFEILSLFHINGNIKYLSSIIISLFLTYIFKNNIYDKAVKTILPWALILYCTLSQSSYIPYIGLIIVIFSFIHLKYGREYFSLAVLVFSTKMFYIGPTIIGDAFHLSEHFIASPHIKSGFFNVFPNIGYLEELPSVLIIKILNLISFNQLGISIATSRSVLSIIFGLIIFRYTYKKNITLSILFLLLLPFDRLSLLISVVYSLLIHDSYINKRSKLFILYVGLMPLVLLGLSPSYSLVIILTMIAIIPFEKLEYKKILLVIFIWAMCLLIFNSQFLKFLGTYKDFSQNYYVGFATTVAILKSKDVFFWSLYTVMVSLISTSIILKKDSLIIKLLKLFLITLVLIQWVSYGYGRIDPGFSRLLPLAIPIILMVNIISDKYRDLTIFMLVATLMFYSQVNLQYNINAINISNLNSNKNPLVQLDEANNKIVFNINKFASGKKVINYSMEPALSYFINNSLVPPFTSPYVTLGAGPQNYVLNFIKENKDAIIYLGHSFMTFDGVDVRLRVPDIFKFIAANYTYINRDGNIYAVPNESSDIPISFNLFFNDMDIKKSSLYYSKNKINNLNYREIVVDCTNNFEGRYKILSEHNFIYADLICGENLIPESFFWGSIVNIQRQ